MNKKKIVVLNFMIISIIFFYSIYKEESYKKENTIILELAPVDPRSIMQGDYMTLTYQLRNEFESENLSSQNEYIVLKADSRGVYHYEKLSEKNVKNSIKVKNVYNFDIGANTYFIKEGSSEHYDKVKYAKLYLLKSGKVRIFKLLDKELNEL